MEWHRAFQLHRLFAFLVDLRRHSLGNALLNDARHQPFVTIKQRISNTLRVIPGAVVVMPHVFRMTHVAVKHPVVEVPEPLVQTNNVIGIQYTRRANQTNSINHHP